MTAGNWTNTSYGTRNVHGNFYGLTIEGTYSSGTTATHKFKYDINSVQIGGVDLEFVFFDETSGLAYSVADQATLDSIFPSTMPQYLPSNTQLNTYKATATGTFNSSRMTAIEITVTYNDDGTGNHTDADYHIDPLGVSPSRPRRSALCFRKIS